MPLQLRQLVTSTFMSLVDLMGERDSIQSRDFLKKTTDGQSLKPVSKMDLVMLQLLGIKKTKFLFLVVGPTRDLHWIYKCLTQ